LGRNSSHFAKRERPSLTFFLNSPLFRATPFGMPSQVGLVTIHRYFSSFHLPRQRSIAELCFVRKRRQSLHPRHSLYVDRNSNSALLVVRSVRLIPQLGIRRDTGRSTGPLETRVIAVRVRMTCSGYFARYVWTFVRRKILVVPVSSRIYRGTRSQKLQGVD